MRIPILLFALLAFLCACSGPASKESEADPAGSPEAASSADAASSPAHEAQDTEAPGAQTFMHFPEPSGTPTLLIGEIGSFPIVMYLDISDTKINGHYFYTKKGKQIDLQGTFDVGGAMRMTESVKGKTTGYLKATMTRDGMNGQWSSKASMVEPLEIQLLTLEAKYDPNGATAQRINGRYLSAHTTTTYDGEDAQGNAVETEHDVEDEMSVRYIGDGYFAFHLSVVGANFHTGEVDGLGRMTDGNNAATKMDDCKLTFEFPKVGEVSVMEEDCEYYHGARANFSGSLTRE